MLDELPGEVGLLGAGGDGQIPRLNHTWLLPAAERRNGHEGELYPRLLLLPERLQPMRTLKIESGPTGLGQLTNLVADHEADVEWQHLVLLNKVAQERDNLNGLRRREIGGPVFVQNRSA